MQSDLWGIMDKLNKEEEIISEAKRIIKDNIKFFESILAHLNGEDIRLKARATFAAWCLHQYLNNQFIDDLERAVHKEKMGEKQIDVH